MDPIRMKTIREFIASNKEKLRVMPIIERPYFVENSIKGFYTKMTITEILMYKRYIEEQLKHLFY